MADDNETPVKGKGTKRKRRNFAAELATLQRQVATATKLLSGLQPTDGSDLVMRVIEMSLEMLEGGK